MEDFISKFGYKHNMVYLESSGGAVQNGGELGRPSPYTTRVDGPGRSGSAPPTMFDGTSPELKTALMMRTKRWI